MPDYQVVIVGGGPAGLSAAMLMGRGRTRAVLCDAGAARHFATAEAHSFLTRDGTPPPELRRIGREQLAPYQTIEVRDTKVTSIERTSDGRLYVSAEGQPIVNTPYVLLATGMVDIHLDIPGYDEFWGRSILNCPYCHGWEFRDQRMGLLAYKDDMLDMGPFLTHWFPDLVIFLKPGIEIPSDLTRQYADKKITVEKRPIKRILGSADTGMIEAVELENGSRVPRDTLFYRPGQRQCELVQGLTKLGLEFTDTSFVKVDEMNQTTVPGIYAAGDLMTAMQQIAVAAKEGVTAAFAIEHSLKGYAPRRPGTPSRTGETSTSHTGRLTCEAKHP